MTVMKWMFWTSGSPFSNSWGERTDSKWCRFKCNRKSLAGRFETAR